MTSTVLITGSSSGIGKATATLFTERGWNVAATMRTPKPIEGLTGQENFVVLPLDVTKPDTISKARDEAIKKFGRVDVLVNNAGYSLFGAFESYTNEQLKQQFDTNLFGLMNVTREFLPHFREQHSGTIINVSSIGGRLTFPFFSAYHATKWAVEGFSESLQYELRPFKVRVKLIEPGPIKTDFYDRSLQPTRHEAYDVLMNKATPKIMESGKSAPGPEAVAKAIFGAATDNSNKLRYPVNAGFLILRKMLSDEMFTNLMCRFAFN